MLCAWALLGVVMMGDSSRGRATAAWRRGYQNVIGKKKHTPFAGRLEGYTGRWVWPGCQKLPKELCKGVLVACGFFGLGAGVEVVSKCTC